MRKLLFILLFFAGFSCHAVDGKPVEQANNIHFLSLADIHFDPFNGCKESPCPLIKNLQQAQVADWNSIFIKFDNDVQQYRKDSTFNLLTSTLTEAKEIANKEQARFVIILGDFLGHDLRSYYKKYTKDYSLQGYQQFVKKIFAFINLQLKNAFPDKDIFAVVGNNDSYKNDYYQDIDGAFFRDIGEQWSNFLQTANSKASFAKTFAHAGYYAVNSPDAKLRIIGLNTVLFSKKARGAAVDLAAQQQLQWLQRELALAKNNQQKVIMLMHIPPGVDVYATFRFKLFTLIEFWRKKELTKFQDLLANYADNIAGLFAGHLHADWFQVLTFANTKGEVPLSGVPAVSPIFGNNPAFRVYQYSPSSAQLNNYVTYFYSLREHLFWQKEYDFNALYNPKCQNCSLISGMKLLPKNPLHEKYYKNFYSVGEDAQPISKHYKPYYFCALQTIDAEIYKKCVTEAQK